MPPATTESPLFVLAMCLLALVPLAWMARAWVREWQDWRAGTLTPDHRDRPPPPTLHQPWRPRMLLVYVAQAAAVAGLMWVNIGLPWMAGETLPPGIYFGSFVVWTILVAFATAVLTRLWDLSAAALARRRSAGRQRQ